MSTVTVTLLGLVAYITLTLVERNSFAFPFNFPMSPISSLSGSELQFVYDSLLRLKRTIVNGESKVHQELGILVSGGCSTQATSGNPEIWTSRNVCLISRKPTLPLAAREPWKRKPTKVESPPFEIGACR